MPFKTTPRQAYKASSIKSYDLNLEKQRNKTSAGTFATPCIMLIAVGQAEISAFQSNPARYTFREDLGYCSPSFCYCGATRPLYEIQGNAGPPPPPSYRDWFYTISTGEANAANTGGGIYNGGLTGIKCYLWYQDATTNCLTSTCT